MTLSARIPPTFNVNLSGYSTVTNPRINYTPPQEQKPSSRRLVYTALHQAVLTARVHQVEILILKCKVNVNSQDLFGRTAAMLCCLIDSTPIANRMLKCIVKTSNCNLDLRDNLGRNALAYACILDKPEIVKTILEADCSDIACPDNDGNSCLYHAAQQGNYETVQLLLNSFQACGCNVDCKNILGYSPFLIACKHGHFLAAAILYYEGGAVAFQADSEFHRTPRDWLIMAINYHKAKHSSTQGDLSSPRRRAKTCIYYHELLRPTNDSSSSNYSNEFTAPAKVFPQMPPTYQALANSALQNGEISSHQQRQATNFTSQRQFTHSNKSIKSDKTETKRQIESLHSMTAMQVAHWLLNLLSGEENRNDIPKTPFYPSSAASTEISQGTSRYLRPKTRELKNFRTGKVHWQATSQSLNTLMNIYSQSVHAVKSAVIPPLRIEERTPTPQETKHHSVASRRQSKQEEFLFDALGEPTKADRKRSISVKRCSIFTLSSVKEIHKEA